MERQTTVPHGFNVSNGSKKENFEVFVNYNKLFLFRKQFSCDNSGGGTGNLLWRHLDKGARTKTFNREGDRDQGIRYVQKKQTASSLLWWLS